MQDANLDVCSFAVIHRAQYLSVSHMYVQEDHMPSYFIAETCKYAYLIANAAFWKVGRSIVNKPTYICDDLYMQALSTTPGVGLLSCLPPSHIG